MLKIQPISTAPEDRYILIKVDKRDNQFLNPYIVVKYRELDSATRIW